MLEVEPTGQHGCMVTRSCRNGNEAVSSAASEALLGGCIISMPSVKLPLV